MTRKSNWIGFISCILVLFAGVRSATSCADVEGVFNVPGNPAISTPLYQINSYDISGPICGNFYILSGPIRIEEQQVSVGYDYCGEDAMDLYYRANWDREIYGGCVYKIIINMTLNWEYWKIEHYQCMGQVIYPAEQGIIIYTPVDNPHPILDYLENRYPFDGSCIAPFPHKDGPPPDEDEIPEESLLGNDDQDDEPVNIPDEQGEPISIFTGNNTHSGTDLQFDSPFGNGLIFKRQYNSRFKSEDNERLPQAINSYGFGWTHTFNSAIGDRGWYIVVDSQNPDIYCYVSYLVLMDETGRTIYFRKNNVGDTEYYGTFNEPSKVYRVGGNYEWHRTDGLTYIFGAASGKLTTILDSNGNQQTLSYNVNGLLETVTDEASSRVLTLSYNADNLLDHISGPVTDGVADGVWVNYDYDTNGNLTSVTYADGSGRIYEYDDPNDPHNLTAEKDQDGNIIYTWTYDSEDRGISNTTNDDRGVTIDYVSDSVIDVTNAYGVTHTFGLSDIANKYRITTVSGPADCPNCGEDAARFAYNANGRVNEVEYINGRIDQYQDYDSRGNAQTEIHDVGTSDQVTIQWVYHPSMKKPLSRVQASALASGNKETIWDYDDDGNQTPNENPTSRIYRLIEKGYTLDEQGSVVSYQYITAFDYNSKGQVISIDGPRPGTADAITYTYDSNTGNLQTMNMPLVGTTTFDQYDAAGNPTLITDPNGIQTALTYDGRNRVLTVTRNGATASTDYSLSGKPDAITDAAGRVIAFQYNTKDFLERIADPSGNYKAFEYTTLGNLENESFFTAGDVMTKTLRYDYGDPLNNPDLETGKPWKAIHRNHDNTVDLETVFTYDAMGNLATATDPNNNTTLYQYDNFDRIVCEERPGQTVTDYEYDTHGNLIGVTDPEGLVTQYLYDDMGRLVKTDSPDTGIVYTLYDEAGNMIRKDSNGQVTTYAFDSANRCTGITYADGSDGVTYVYDSGNGQYLQGRLASVSDSSETRHFSYDANGYLDTEQRIIQGVTYFTDYDFDAAGNLRTIVYPIGQTVEYQPDATDVGLVASVRLDPAGDDVALAGSIGYQPFGPVSALTLGNGLQTDQSFDLNYQVAAITSGTVLNRTYTPDSLGNIQTITDNLDATRSQNFTYDSLQRLTHAGGIYGSVDFTYDRTGNRLTRTANDVTDTYTYVTGTNQLEGISGSATTAFDYDAHGNLIGRTFVTGSPPSSEPVQDYTYTHDGQRQSKTENGQSTVYHYDINGQLIAETDAGGTMLKAYIWFNGQPLAQIATDGSICYYHNDHLGTPQRMTNNSGTVVWAADYLPFGQTDVNVAAVENNLRFAGQYFDQETGLHYNYWRFYDPILGRYLRADPIGLVGGINPYAYVQNDPANKVDPYGLDGIYIHYDGYPINTGFGFKLPLGHAGVVAVDPKTGSTRYYEYGRYDSNFGQVKRRVIPDVKIGPDGKPTSESLNKLYDYLSKNLGKDSPISAEYYSDADYQKIIDFAQNRMNDPNRDPYSWNPLNPNHCKTFAKEAITAARPCE